MTPAVASPPNRTAHARKWTPGDARRAASSTDTPAIPPHLWNALLEMSADGVLVRGNSMWPFLADGSRVHLVKPGDALPTAGSLVAFPHGAEVTVHRVVRWVRREGRVHLLTRGDLNPCLDPDAVPVAALIGSAPRLPAWRRLVGLVVLGLSVLHVWRVVYRLWKLAHTA